jgi:hypothetical protein
VKKRCLTFAVLLWLGWYIAGPVAETFDFWDTPRQEFHDITRNAGGGIALVAAVFALGIAAARKWRDVRAPLGKVIRRLVELGASVNPGLAAALHSRLSAAHSPPSPLRI